MEELGYQPNRLARSLRSGKTHTIGTIVPDSADPFFAEVARGIEDTAFENGYSLIRCNSDANLDKEAFYTDVLVEKQVDGILFLATGVSVDHHRPTELRRGRKGGQHVIGATARPRQAIAAERARHRAAIRRSTSALCTSSAKC